MEQQLIVKDKEGLIKKYNSLKTKYFSLRDEITLQHYSILSNAYDIGKRIRKDFNEKMLAKDFQMGEYRVKEILSLDKANKRTWNLIKQKKVSTYKLSIILTHKIDDQDKMVDYIMKHSYLTADNIRMLKIPINDEKTEVESYKPNLNNYRVISGIITRLNFYLIQPIDTIPIDVKEPLKKRLREAKRLINNYLMRL